jgi:hypothetical protein
MGSFAPYDRTPVRRRLRPPENEKTRRLNSFAGIRERTGFLKKEVRT